MTGDEIYIAAIRRLGLTQTSVSDCGRVYDCSHLTFLSDTSSLPLMLMSTLLFTSLLPAGTAGTVGTAGTAGTAGTNANAGTAGSAGTASATQVILLPLLLVLAGTGW